VWLVPTLIGLGCNLLPNNQCVYDGRKHAHGDTFMSADGCNTCSCSSGGSVACTTRACLPDAGNIDAAQATDAPMSCTFAGQSYIIGATFRMDCNTCTCRAAGRSECTEIACLDGGPPAADGECSFGLDGYNFQDTGGVAAFVDHSSLYSRTHMVSRDHLGMSPNLQCSRVLPCGDSSLVDIAEIQLALAHPDVVSALSRTDRPFFGTDPGPFDGSAFMFERWDGRGFFVGTGSVPAGLRALVDLLHLLRDQTVATPQCTGL
jgi:hypothetical protein